MSDTAMGGIDSTRLHAVMYSLLLVATPFVLLQSFLVEQISHASMSRCELAGLDLPALPILGVIVLAIGLILARRHLTWLRLTAGVIVLAMIMLAQQITDYYFDHNFYDLQQNWHYFAYGLFALFVYRDLQPRGASMARVILTTCVAALLFSAFDEGFQMTMSSRVFDVSDIAKDLWGAFSGVIFLYLVVSAPADLAAEWKQIRHRPWRAYFEHPPSLLLLLFVFALALLCYGSLLSDSEYILIVTSLTVVTWLVFFLILHLSRYDAVISAVVVVLVLAAVGQAYAFFLYRNDNITHNSYGLTVYKGIPIPFFDVMILPEGGIRLVDKKHYFNDRDQEFFQKQRADIILVGSGAEGLGGNGFPSREPSQFIYNEYLERGTQVIILESSEACKVFNRLKKEGKRVLFILHNTC